MLEAGEDPLFIARRMVIFAAEDVGNADPQALQVAVAAKDAVHFVGLPEGRIPLAQAATYLATAPKSNAVLQGDARRRRGRASSAGALPVPLHLRNAPTPLMKGLGYGAGYRYAHDYEGAVVEQDYLPEAARRTALLRAGGSRPRARDRRAPQGLARGAGAAAEEASALNGLARRPKPRPPEQ